MRAPNLLFVPLLFAAMLCATPAGAADRVRVVAPAGAISGVQGDGFVSFKGIPYAAPPLGALRWQKPQPAAKWSGDLDASDFGPSCMQPTPPAHVVPGSPALTLSEDCLKLNIWAPAGARKAPVMVWIHGGGNQDGSPADFFTDGRNIARDGVILVSVNYRLGLLGFFAYPGLSENGKAVANFGLWDQVAALQWVRANIPAFGGDPDNVTVFGQSAGGEDIIALLAAPVARGLFAKAIVQSGGGGWGPTADIKDLQTTIAGKFPGKSLADLRAMPAADLVKQNGDLADPVVDHDLLPQTPLAAFAAGQAANVPIVIGTTDEEGSLLGNRDQDPTKSWDRLTPADLTTLRAVYGDRARDDTAFARLLFRDGYFAGPARFIARHSTAYLYRFSYVLTPLQGRRTGAWHGSDVPYVFERWPIDPVDATDLKVQAAIHSDWIAFATTGHPGWVALKASGQEMSFDAAPSPRIPDDAAALDLLEKRLSPFGQP
jgi:para-nitrobenzyl esterase